MSHNPKKAEKEMEKAIFIAADCWLCVFDLLLRSQLGHGIALISHRFDFYVDEHFKTRKWTLGNMEIRSKIGKNGTKEMEVVNANGETLPIPQVQLPRKFVGFGSLLITYIDQNVLTFLHRFHRFFGTFETKFLIHTENVRISMFALRTIWPMFIDTIRVKRFNSVAFRQMRQFAPSMLSECPCLRVVAFDDGISPEFPPDDSATASDGQALAKWLFTPRPDNLAKVLSLVKLEVVVQQWVSTLEQIKAAFSIASSPVSFVISVCVWTSPPIDFSVVAPFELTNKFTQERLTLVPEVVNTYRLVRCSIAADGEGKWLSELRDELMRGQKDNKFGILIGDDGVDKGLLDDLPGPSGDQKQQMK